MTPKCWWSEMSSRASPFIGQHRNNPTTEPLASIAQQSWCIGTLPHVHHVMIFTGCFPRHGSQKGFFFSPARWPNKVLRLWWIHYVCCHIYQLRLILYYFFKNVFFLELHNAIRHAGQSLNNCFLMLDETSKTQLQIYLDAVCSFSFLYLH